jgi:acetyl esterase/lipase
MRRMVHAACLTLCIANTTLAQARVHRNVVYGMFSGRALLMDVHVPDRPNGLGILLIPGSGFHTAQGYDGASIKDGGSAAFAFLPSILDAGYTVFVVNHRAAPTFRYPAAVQDVQRAVRFVPGKAAEYGIEGTRLGVVGYSSGGYLAVMLGVLDGTETPRMRQPRRSTRAGWRASSQGLR